MFAALQALAASLFVAELHVLRGFVSTDRDETPLGDRPRPAAGRGGAGHGRAGRRHGGAVAIPGRPRRPRYGPPEGHARSGRRVSGRLGGGIMAVIGLLEVPVGQGWQLRAVRPPDDVALSGNVAFIAGMVTLALSVALLVSALTRLPEYGRPRFRWPVGALAGFALLSTASAAFELRGVTGRITGPDRCGPRPGHHRIRPGHHRAAGRGGRTRTEKHTSRSADASRPGTQPERWSPHLRQRSDPRRAASPGRGRPCATLRLFAVGSAIGTAIDAWCVPGFGSADNNTVVTATWRQRSASAWPPSGS